MKSVSIGAGNSLTRSAGSRSQRLRVAMIGDSVSTGIHVSTTWNTIWRARSCRDRNWFLNVDPATPIRSVSKRLGQLTPLFVSHHGGVGAMVDDESERLWFSRQILGTRNFSGQVNQLKRSDWFPDLILISIGHNNVDWAWRCPPDELEKTRKATAAATPALPKDLCAQPATTCGSCAPTRSTRRDCGVRVG